MRDLEGFKEKIAALKEEHGNGKFFDILTLSFFEAFLGAMAKRTFPVSLFFFSHDEKSGEIHILGDMEEYLSDEKHLFSVNLTELLLGTAITGIPVILSGAENYPGNTATIFLKLLFGTPPKTYLSQLDEEIPGKDPLSEEQSHSLLIGMDSLLETEDKILERIENRDTPFESEAPVVVLIDSDSRTKESHSRQENTRQRFLTLSIPTIATRDSLSFLSQENTKNDFKECVEYLGERFCHYLEAEKEICSDFQEQWPFLYREMANHIQNSAVFLNSSREWLEFAVVFLGSDREKSFSRETAICARWAKKFDMEAPVSFSELEKDLSAKSVEKLFNTYPYGLSVKDSGRVYKLAPYFSVLNRARQSFSSSNPVESYFETPSAITIRDICVPLYVILKERAGGNGTDLQDILNDSIASYYKLVDSLKSSLQREESIHPENPAFSVRNRVIHLAIIECLQKTDGVNTLERHFLEFIQKLESISESESGLLRLHVLLLSSDIYVLTGFLDFYRKELNLIINCFGKDSQVEDVLVGLKRFFDEKRKSAALVMPAIFQQRIPRILGMDA